MFSGILFIANASFNNLKRAHYATFFNFCRVLLGTIPLVYLLAQHYGARGVLAGEMFSALIFGLAAFATVLYTIGRLEHGEALLKIEGEADEGFCETDDGLQAPFSSPRSLLGQKIVQHEE